MSKIKKQLFIDAVTTAYCETAPKKLADLVRPVAENYSDRNNIHRH